MKIKWNEKCFSAGLGFERTLLNEKGEKIAYQVFPRNGYFSTLFIDEDGFKTLLSKKNESLALAKLVANEHIRS